MQTYAPPPAWTPPASIKDTTGNAYPTGEPGPRDIHEAVGRALSTWEHAESSLVKLFQVLCETRSYAAARALGTMDSVRGRADAINFAAEEFFRRRDQDDHAQVRSLIATYSNAAAFRNRIAHGMAMQPHSNGYFLCPASDAAKKRGSPAYWPLGAAYFYRPADIDHCRTHFEAIMAATMSMVLYLIEKYRVVEQYDLHP